MKTSAENLCYAYKVNNEHEPGETCVYRHKETLNKDLISATNETRLTVKDELIQSFMTNAEKDCLGSRNPHDGNKYSFKKYKEVFELAKWLGVGMTHLKLVQEICEYKNIRFKPFGIFSSNRLEWSLCDFAACLYGYTSIPLYATLGLDALQYILQLTNISTVFCSEAALHTILKLPKVFNLSNIVCMDLVKEEVRKQVEQKGITFFDFKFVVESSKGQKELEFDKDNKPNDMITMSFTSGTTGMPKGVMLSNRNITSSMAAWNHSQAQITQQDTHLSWLPLPHIYERVVFYECIRRGATIGYWQGDPAKLAEDLQELKPTVFFGVPRIFTRFYDKIKSVIASLAQQQRKEIEQIIDRKIKRLHETGEVISSSDEIENQVLTQKFKCVFGGKTRFMLTGSAPISSQVLDFLKVTTCTPIMEAYGQTETSPPSFITCISDGTSGHIGGVTTNVEFKLQDIPETGYFSSDLNEFGRCCPRGELLMRGPGIFMGYYKDPIRTEETLDQHKWCHSGDVAILLPNGAIQLIDRRKNIFKLSQGEYVAPEEIQRVYKNVHAIVDIFVHGDSLQSYLVGIVEPNREHLQLQAKQMGIPFDSYEALCKEEAMRQYILDLLTQEGQAAGLTSFMQVKKIALEPQSMLQLGVCTTSFKLKRNEARLHFKDMLHKLYND